MSDLLFVQSSQELEPLLRLHPLFNPPDIRPSVNWWRTNQESVPRFLLRMNADDSIPFTVRFDTPVYRSHTSVVFKLPRTNYVIAYHKLCPNGRWDFLAAEYWYLYYVWSQAPHIVPQPIFLSSPASPIDVNTYVSEDEWAPGKIDNMLCLNTGGVVAQVRYIIMEQFGSRIELPVGIFKAARITQAVLAMVQTLHEELNVVHGNITPENILYDESSDRVKLIDFKNSRFVSDPDALRFVSTNTVNLDIYSTPWSLFFATSLPRDDVFQVFQLFAFLVHGQSLAAHLRTLGARSTNPNEHRPGRINHYTELVSLKRSGELFDIPRMQFDSLLPDPTATNLIRNILINAMQTILALGPSSDVPYNSLREALQDVALLSVPNDI